MKTIGVCGMGYTGSGAVIDLMKEFDDVDVNADPEFSLSYTPDGLEDLEYHLVKAPSRYMSSDVAIYRFKKFVEGRNNKGSGIRKATNNQFYVLSMNYISKITQLKWKGYWGWDFTTANFWKRNVIFRLLNSRITPIIGKMLHRNIDLPPVREMCMSITPENFYDESRKYINALIHSMGLGNKEIVVLNQPFAADHPSKSFIYFEDPYAIIVDRDPRDVYVLMKRVSLEAGRFIPTTNVRDFVTYYRILHERQEDGLGNPRILHLKFETLIYEYETTVSWLMAKLGLQIQNRKGRFFNPEVSINNTQLFLRYPQFKEDCEYIEKELKEWLFPFNDYDLKPNWRSTSF